MSIQSLNPTTNTYCDPLFKQPSFLDTIAFEAIQGKDSQKLKEALENGANPNAQIRLNHEIAHLIVNELADDDQGILDFLFHKEYFHALFDYLELPLIAFASYMCDHKAINLLTEYGARLDFKLEVRGEQIFPLSLEASDSKKIIDVVKLLHDKGIPIKGLISTEFSSPEEFLLKAYEEQNQPLINFLESIGYELPTEASEDLSE